MRKLTPFLATLLLAAASHAQSEKVTTKTTDKDVGKIRSAAEAAVANEDWAAAAASFRQLVEADPQDARAWHMLGYTLHANKDLDAALTAHLKAAEFPATAPVASYNAACVYALRDKKEEALTWLEKAASLGFGLADHMRDDSDMDGLRSLPRFQAVLTKVEKNASSPQLQVFTGAAARRLTRMVMWRGQGSAGGVSISYGQPKWQDKYAEMVDAPKLQNRRWRLGKDEWTTLDASVPLTLGDKQLAAGLYYLTLERRGSDFVLTALDPASVHKHTIDPYSAHLTTGGTEVVLQHSTGESSAQLEIELATKVGSVGAGELTIRFGPHRLSAPVTLQRTAEKAEK